VKIKTRSRLFVIFAGAFLTVSALNSCGINFLSYVSPGKEETKAQIEDAKILMDAKDYEGAASLLNKLKDDSSKDSNEVRLMLASANLGISGLDIWSVIGTALDSTSKSSGGSSTVFDSLGDLLGEGEVKNRKIQALQDAIDDLNSAPDPDATNVKNTACFLAGIMIVPILADATTAMTSLQSAISSVSTGDCDGAAELSTALGDISESAVRFSLVLDTAVSCPFLDIDTSSVDGVNGAMQSLIKGADKGCSNLPAGAEQLLPQCVRDAAGIPNTSAASDDGRIDSCELVLHCSTPTDCF